MPSKTWIRARCPSITLKWTRTVSPALNCGMSARTWARSIDSMTLLIGGGPAGRAGMVANPLVERDPARRPVRREHVADQVLLRNESPDAGVAGRLPVVAHHQVHVLRDARVGVPRRDVGQPHCPVVPAVGFDVRLVQLLAVDVNEALPLFPHLPRQ